MLSLYYKSENIVEVDGNKYSVNLSFDNVLKLIDMLNDKDIDDKYKVILGVNMMLGVSFLLPFEKWHEIFDSVFSTFVINKSEEKVETDLDGNPMPPKYKEDTKNNYSLKHDADYIFASFYQAYRIDLIEQQGKLSWDKFNALLSGLPSDTKFKEILDIRNWTPYKGCPKEEKKQMKELKKVYALPGEEGESEWPMDE